MSYKTDLYIKNIFNNTYAQEIQLFQQIPKTEKKKPINYFKLYKTYAEFKKIAKRDKKAFFSEQCKEIEENNRMAKTTDLFKKIGAIKGTFTPNFQSKILTSNGFETTCTFGWPKNFVRVFPQDVTEKPEPTFLANPMLHAHKIIVCSDVGAPKNKV